MDFVGDIGTWQRRAAEGPAGVARRSAAFETLRPRLGQSVLDIGCGGGHLLRDLARAVGPQGSAVGLDLSAEQLDVARSYCADEPAAELVEGDATALPFPDASFDGVCSVQTLEYIADIPAALAECRRVLRPGGRVALISLLWDHFRFHGADAALTERILDLFRLHCPHQMLPLAMPGHLERAGFTGIERRPLAFMNDALHGNAYPYWTSRVVAAFAVTKGLAKADAQAWLDQLARADGEDRFAFVSVPVLTFATAA